MGAATAARAPRLGESLAAWWALLAPGLLLARALVLLAVVIIPTLTTRIFLLTPGRQMAVLLLILHVASGGLIVRWPRTVTLVAGAAVLAVDAFFSGVLWGAELSWCAPGAALAIVALLSALTIGGWSGVLACAAMLGLGIGFASIGDMPPVVGFTPRVSFALSLSVETEFDGAPVVETTPDDGGAALSVEGDFPGAGRTRGTERRTDSTVPCGAALVFACIAWSIGGLVCILRVRGARPAGASEGGGARSWFGVVALCVLVPVVAHGACDLSGRGQFAEGLDALSRHDLDAAAAVFDSLVRAQPECAEARNNLAVVFFEQGRFDEAAQQLQQALTLQPDYQRARSNLQRIAALRAARTPLLQPAAPGEVPLLIATATVPAATATATLVPTLTPTATPLPTAIAVATPPLGPGAIALLEPPGAVACAIEPQRHRLCLYRQKAGQVMTDDCYALTDLRLLSQPQWGLVRERTGQWIWLVNERGKRALVITPKSGTLDRDVAGLPEGDFTALTVKLTPWQTVCVVSDEPLASARTPPNTVTELRNTLDRWRRAWGQKQFENYIGFYSNSFIPQIERTATQWRARKRTIFAQPGEISVDIGPLSVFLVDEGTAAVTLFEQTYRMAARSTRSLKAIRWQRVGDQWRITTETVLREAAAEAE